MPMAGEKILVVDDHKEMVDLIEETFRLRGYEVVGATNGQEALAKVYQEKPDLVLLDVMMPVIDGYEICQTLKTNEETKHIPIVLITVKGSESDIERGFEARADGYVVKPFEPPELTEFAEKFLKKSKEQV